MGENSIAFFCWKNNTKFYAIKIENCNYSEYGITNVHVAFLSSYVFKIQKEYSRHSYFHIKMLKIVLPSQYPEVHEVSTHQRAGPKSHVHD